jgi:hypothetical protein
LFGWEVFQFAIKGINVEYVFDGVDSIWDIIWGTVGALVAVWWGKLYCVKTG